MRQPEQLYLELLKASLQRQTPREELFVTLGTPLWEQVCTFSDRQRTTAMVADRILSLPEELQPPRLLRLKLLLQREQIEKRNDQVNRVLGEITAQYNDLDCPAILLKGQGAALNYPVSRHRTPGDIDLFFFRKGDYERANRWVREQGIRCEQESVKHLGFDWKGVHIENHRVMATFERPKYNRRYGEEEDRLIRAGNWKRETMGGSEVLLLPPTFNACYLFLHLFHHFIHAGVSTRQLSDWILLLQQKQQEIDHVEAAHLFDRLALSRPASLFAAAAVRYLEIPPEVFPIPPAKESPDITRIMEDLLHGGHFGKHRPGKKRPTGTWSGRWHSYKQTTRRSLTMRTLSPEHIPLLPLYKLMTRMKLTFRKNS